MDDIVFGVRLESGTLLEAARNMLRRAEENRRGEMRKFETAPLRDECAYDDWGAAMQLISHAMHHLDESVPNGQLTRTRQALGALKIGLALTEAALKRRDVHATLPSLGSAAV